MYFALKALKFDRRYAEGEPISEAVIDSDMAEKLMKCQVIRWEKEQDRQLKKREKESKEKRQEGLKKRKKENREKEQEGLKEKEQGQEGLKEKEKGSKEKGNQESQLKLNRSRQSGRA